LDRHTAEDGNDYIVTHINDLMDAVKDLLIATFGPTQSYRGTKSERSSLRSFTSSLIHRYVNAVKWELQGNRLLPTIPRAIRDEVLMLKELTWTYVIQDPGLATQQIGQRNMIRTLYNVYRIEAASQKGRRIFPAFYQERLDEAVDESERLRICIDLIAGMTESQVQRMYTRITGGSAESSLSDPLR
jgi:dGTPase